MIVCLDANSVIYLAHHISDDPLSGRTPIRYKSISLAAVASASSTAPPKICWPWNRADVRSVSLPELWLPAL